MCVLLVAAFFVNPLSLSGRSGRVGDHAGGMRTLSVADSPNEIAGEDHMINSVIYGLFWVLRIVLAAGCFGWMTLWSMPKITPNSSDAVRFWRFRKQAENDLRKVS